MSFLNLDGLKHFYDKYLKPLKGASKCEITQSLTTTTAGYVLDARAGKTLDTKIAKNASDITSLNADLEVKTRTIEGAFVNMQITEQGRQVWIRISSAAAKPMTQGQEYEIFDVTSIKPLYSIYRRIDITDALGIIFKISVDGKFSILPFGGAIPQNTGINISEWYIKSQ